MCPREASCRRRAELWRIRPHAFKQQFDLKDVHFVVDATNEGSLNQLTITSTGLNESNEQAVAPVSDCLTAQAVE
jgi:hypothetical protein